MLEKLIKNMARDPAMNTVVRPARPPSLPPADWPKLDGIEANIAFTSLNGDTELLRRLLSTVLAEYADLADGSDDSTQPSDETLATRLHKLIGAAGTLGAMQLSAAATAWEAGLKSAGPAERDAFRSTLASELQRLRAATLSQLPAATATLIAANDTTWTTSAHSAVPANQDLDKLVDLLRRQSFRAIELFETMSTSLQHEMSDTHIERLRTCLHALQYKDALQVLSEAGLVDRESSKAS